MGRVFIGGEFSGVVREAFRALGHDAWSCDLEPPLPDADARRRMKETSHAPHALPCRTLSP